MDKKCLVLRNMESLRHYTLALKDDIINVCVKQPIHLMASIVLPVVFVCVEVLRPSQPNGVMSTVVSLPNHTFTGQA